MIQEKKVRLGKTNTLVGFVWVVAVTVFLFAVASQGCNPSSERTDPSKIQRASEAPPAEPRPVVSRPEIRFASHQKLVEHYQKHGREFGSVTMEAYLHQAQELRDGPAAGSVLQFVRADGVISRFNRTNGDFIAFNPDGVIRTYFRPNDGEAYFRRQARRDK
jgi:pyocin large subunit-like protein